MLLAGYLAGCGDGSSTVATPSARPPSTDFSPRSLYSGPEPRPGPDILYAAPAKAPQLENTGIWRAQPILISGASAYRDGEFLYQDFLYDDHGANGILPDLSDPRTGDDLFSRPAGTYTYPTDPAYANNAADLIEFRVKSLPTATAFRVTLNTLLDPERVAFTLALGDSSASRVLPHGANTTTPAAWFLTVHGSKAELLDAASGAVIAPAPTVSVDLPRRQFEVRLPHAAWNPAQAAVPMALGVGLWDSARNAYLVPGLQASNATPGGGGLMSAPSAFFNLGFRYDEPMPDVANGLSVVIAPSWWRDQAQAEALAAGDLGRFRAQVDFSKLAAGVNDDMPDQPGGVPTHGPMNRIFASHVETAQGATYPSACGGAAGCVGALRGQLQPYALYAPQRAAPPEGGYGLTLLLHSLGANYNQYLDSRHQAQLGERGRGYLIITPAGRGPDGWYVEHAGADTFEVWADVARHYPLHPDFASVSGYSMGGYGTFRFATRYPDLFSRAHTVVGPPAIGAWLPPLQPSPGPASNTFESLASLRNLPILMWVALTDELVPYLSTLTQARGLDALGYRYGFESYAPAEHLTFAINDEYAPAAEFLGDEPAQRNPAHITYVVNPAMDFPGVGMIGDHAYWLSGMTVRDTATPGTVDAISLGFGHGDAPVGSTQFGGGALTGGTLPAIVYIRQSRTWGAAPATAQQDRLQLTARNLATVTVHATRAHLNCGAQLVVDTDGPLKVRLDGCNRVENFGP
ncbi:MAG: glucodextranase DOMON-like domain-containing protein [Nevskiales bacterium]